MSERHYTLATGFTIGRRQRRLLKALFTFRHARANNAFAAGHTGWPRCRSIMSAAHLGLTRIMRLMCYLMMIMLATMTSYDAL